MKSIRLKLNILKFKARKKYLFEKEKLSVRRVFLYEILINIFVAFIVVFSLYIIEYIASSLYKNLYQDLPNWLIEIVELIPKPIYPESQDPVNGYVSLLASIAGVLLALFYPILATIASSGYAKVNSSIRNLLFLEPITQNYLRRLAFLTAFSVYVLLFATFGYYPGNLILIYLSILGLISLFNLLKIGAGVYSLFEPETLANIANKQIVENINNVTIKSPYWNKINFQDFFRRQVEKDLEILRLLNSISIEGLPINKKSFLTTVNQTLGLLEYYLSKKNNIPLTSSWFKKKRTHQSYFETDMSTRELAIGTRTYVFPKQVLNNFWFEEQIFRIYSEIGKKVTSLDDPKVRYEYLNKSVRALQYFGYSMEFDLANKLLSENLKITKESLIHNDKNTYENSNENLILIETMISSSVRNFHISFFESVEHLNKEVFNQEISKIKWDDKSSLYKLKLPYQLNSFFEDYFKFIKNEKIVEAKQITPIWYIIQHLTAEYLLILEKHFNNTIDQIEKFILPLINSCKENNNHLAVSFACHCSLELIDKLKFRIPRIEHIMVGFDSNNKHIGRHKWTKIDTEKALKKLNRFNDLFVYDIASSMSKICSLKWNENNPDIFAHSFTIISNEINECYLSADLDKFKKIFPNFLESALSSFFSLYLRYQNKYYNDLEIIYQVHIELIQLSGLGYIYTELLETSFWEEIIKAWDEIELNKNHIELIMSSYNFYKNDKHGTGINFTDNFNRQKKLRQLIENKDIDVKKYNDTIIRRYVSNDIYIDKEYEDIFLELYLFTFIDARESVMAIDEGRRSVFFDINRIIEKKYGKV
ncbi:hypothetical protein [Winogradskyella sp.]|uniref:hypothetical protein n=1 Tax=Winogradskyella sp. TaxID=1883156 RepID=UPI003BA9BFE6